MSFSATWFKLGSLASICSFPSWLIIKVEHRLSCLLYHDMTLLVYVIRSVWKWDYCAEVSGWKSCRSQVRRWILEIISPQIIQGWFFLSCWKRSLIDDPDVSNFFKRCRKAVLKSSQWRRTGVNIQMLAGREEEKWERRGSRRVERRLKSII